MFNEDLSVFFNDFSETVIYSDGLTGKQIQAIIDHDVELVGFEGQISGVATTFTVVSDNAIIIGGTFRNISDTYIIDDIISDDKKLMTVSVVKQ